MIGATTSLWKNIELTYNASVTTQHGSIGEVSHKALHIQRATEGKTRSVQTKRKKKKKQMRSNPAQRGDCQRVVDETITCIRKQGIESMNDAKKQKTGENDPTMLEPKFMTFSTCCVKYCGQTLMVPRTRDSLIPMTVRGSHCVGNAVFGQQVIVLCKAHTVYEVVSQASDRDS